MLVACCGASSCLQCLPVCAAAREQGQSLATQRPPLAARVQPARSGRMCAQRSGVPTKARLWKRLSQARRTCMGKPFTGTGSLLSRPADTPTLFRHPSEQHTRTELRSRVHSPRASLEIGTADPARPPGLRGGARPRNPMGCAPAPNRNREGARNSHVLSPRLFTLSLLLSSFFQTSGRSLLNLDIFDRIQGPSDGRATVATSHP